jgi:hypothetical protein
MATREGTESNLFTSSCVCVCRSETITVYYKADLLRDTCEVECSQLERSRQNSYSELL